MWRSKDIDVFNLACLSYIWTIIVEVKFKDHIVRLNDHVPECFHFPGLKLNKMYHHSEFEELEAVPTMAVMDGPLEPSAPIASSVTDLPDDLAFVNFFSVSTFLFLCGYSFLCHSVWPQHSLPRYLTYMRHDATLWMFSNLSEEIYNSRVF